MQLAQSKDPVEETDRGMPVDCRDAKKFPIQLEVRYREFGQRSGRARGTGTTVNMGAKSVVFTTNHNLRLGARVELAMNWPARLDGKTALWLVIQGRVTHCQDGQAVVAIQRHEFRTQRSSVAH